MTLSVAIIAFCAKIGRDPLLVQASGGNVSWKEGGTLWIKASGMWLGQAADKNVFVSVDLLRLQDGIERGDFKVLPEPQGVTNLRPSIETLLHVLMPHRIVVHLHAVEILAHLIREHCETDIRSKIDLRLKWAMVDYLKPGAALAAAIKSVLDRGSVDILFLKNHGVVIGADDVEAIEAILTTLSAALQLPVPILATPSAPSFLASPAPYVFFEDRLVQELVFNTIFFDRLDTCWALYPDHVVFLGPKACAYENWDSFKRYQKDNCLRLFLSRIRAYSFCPI